MWPGDRILRLPDGASFDLSTIVDALEAQFGVEAAAAEDVRRTRLDTFDRRLRASGLILEHLSTRRSSQLVLHRSGQGPLAVDHSEPAWPALANDLPASAVRDAVAPVMQVRALVVIIDEERRVRRLDLRNADQKIVARVEIAEPKLGGAPAMVVVRSLRGYEKQAQAAERLIIGAGLRPASADSDTSTPRPWTIGIDPSSPGRLLLARRLQEFLAAIRDNLEGTIADIDTEFLHDLRVAVRRTRSTLKLGRPALPQQLQTTWEPEFKWVGDLTTPVRDLDVYELDLPVLRSWLVSTNPDDLDPLAALLRRRRISERRKLVRALTSPRFQRLLAEWEHTLSALESGGADGPTDEPAAGELADQCITRAYRRVVKLGSAIAPDSPAEDLHTLRKRCKELRYAVEVFAPVIDRERRKRAVSDLKVLQDVLGRFQDADVQRSALRGLADDLVAAGSPAGTLLAMGELIGHLDADQEVARNSFDNTFADFVRPAGRRHFQRLGVAG